MRMARPWRPFPSYTPLPLTKRSRSGFQPHLSLLRYSFFFPQGFLFFQGHSPSTNPLPFLRIEHGMASFFILDEVDPHSRGINRIQIGSSPSSPTPALIQLHTPSLFLRAPCWERPPRRLPKTNDTARRRPRAPTSNPVLLGYRAYHYIRSCAVITLWDRVVMLLVWLEHHHDHQDIEEEIENEEVEVETGMEGVGTARSFLFLFRISESDTLSSSPISMLIPRSPPTSSPEPKCTSS